MLAGLSGCAYNRTLPPLPAVASQPKEWRGVWSAREEARRYDFRVDLTVEQPTVRIQRHGRPPVDLPVKTWGEVDRTFFLVAGQREPKVSWLADWYSFNGEYIAGELQLRITSSDCTCKDYVTFTRGAEAAAQVPASASVGAGK